MDTFHPQLSIFSQVAIPASHSISYYGVQL